MNFFRFHTVALCLHLLLPLEAFSNLMCYTACTEVEAERIARKMNQISEREFISDPDSARLFGCLRGSCRFNLTSQYICRLLGNIKSDWALTWVARTFSCKHMNPSKQAITKLHAYTKDNKYKEECEIFLKSKAEKDSSTSQKHKEEYQLYIQNFNSMKKQTPNLLKGPKICPQYYN